MKRTLVFAVVALMMAGAAFAQCPMMEAGTEPGPHGMQMGMQHGPMGSMMGALDTAVHDNFVYVLQGNVLEKRDMDGNTVQSVRLTDMEERMEQMHDEGVCPVCGIPEDMETRAACPGGMMGGMEDGGHAGMMGDDATERGMRHMQRGAMQSKVKLEADADGVYLLRGGHFTKFDHDLNKQKSWDAVSETCLAKDDSVQCAMRQMQRAECPTCRMMTGRLVDERGIERGSVEMWHRPRVLTADTARFQVQVYDQARRGDREATVSAFIYPRGNVDAGMGVPIQSLGGGHFYGLTDIPHAGDWLLSVRVVRPGMDDQLLYYDLPVE